MHPSLSALVGENRNFDIPYLTNQKQTKMLLQIAPRLTENAMSFQVPNYRE